MGSNPAMAAISFYEDIMGYYTRYELADVCFMQPNGKLVSVTNENSLVKQLNQLHLLLETNPDLAQFIDPSALRFDRNYNLEFFKDNIAEFIGFNPFIDSHKWYDYTRDMAKYSRSYPDLVFVLKGYGEDSLDIWQAYFYNGTMQLAETHISFSPFDIHELVTVI